MTEKVEIELSDTSYTKEIVRSDGIIYVVKVYQVTEDNPLLWGALIAVPLLASVATFVLSLLNGTNTGHILEWIVLITAVTVILFFGIAFAILKTRRSKRIK